jgi:hypothetical protein
MKGVSLPCLKNLARHIPCFAGYLINKGYRRITMNLFENATALSAVAESKMRKGIKGNVALNLTIPYFQGVVRRGESYSLSLTRKEGRKNVAVQLQVKPLSGAFILSYFVCLASCIAQEAKQPCTTFLVQALITQEGFTLSEYAQGKIAGASRVAKHLKDLTKQGKISVSVSEKGVITGLTPEMINAVLTAF